VSGERGGFTAVSSVVVLASPYRGDYPSDGRTVGEFQEGADVDQWRLVADRETYHQHCIHAVATGRRYFKDPIYRIPLSIVVTPDDGTAVHVCADCVREALPR